MEPSASPSGCEAPPLSFLTVPDRVQRAAEVRALFLGLFALGVLTAVFVASHLENPAIVTLSFLLVVLVAATMSTRRVAIVVSIGASLCFNFFFLEPVGTLRIAKAQNLAELVTLLAVSIVASQLSSQVREAQVLRQSAELKSALLESLSHALRTPLTAVTVAADNLSRPSLTVDERRDQAEIMRTEIERLNRLFQDVVDMARIETRAVVVEREWVQPAEIMEAASTLAQSGCDPRRLCVDPVSEPALVRIDPRLTSAALAHVLENASQYSPAASPIQVKFALEVGALRITVRDHGIGIRADEQHRLFDRAFRGSAAHERRFGTGLGLTIARGLIAAEGGSIEVINHPEGGTLVTIALPAATRPTASIREAAL
jgi:two-component system, OmpR family, sensor histidine kinase KdpD